ncbi:hypothetical protein DFH08DRAFT_725687 [Mycena albidolilacea]|uniref:BTB domain-containing protein n=1 Tax=Mycena albidolilacea TaxID=1033008 RepID=A0AAD7F636_9AGAR|nr:hypothetical protein DFH08DRAFT_725687 [Mycena albidolilacea]
MSEAATIRDASDPFSPSSDQEVHSDLILRSSDLVDFFVHKVVLSFASLVFRDMFAFPQPVGEDANLIRDGKPVVHLPESSQTIEKLLTLCYPRFTSSYGFNDLDGVDGAYEAAGKYEIQGGQKLLERLLEEPKFLEKQPHRVFAIACHRGLQKLAKAAAMETLKLPRYVPHISVPEFKFISAHQLRQLEDFHYSCSNYVVQHVRGLAGSVPYDMGRQEGANYNSVWWDTEGHGVGCGARGTREEDVYDVYEGLEPAPWFQQHIQTVAEAAACCPDVKTVSKDMVNISGPTLKVMPNCPKCLAVAQDSLSDLAEEIGMEVPEVFQSTLAKISFVN